MRECEFLAIAAVGALLLALAGCERERAPETVGRQTEWDNLPSDLMDTFSNG